MESYDVVVLGGGSAGETVATTVARGGKSVAVVEERLLGGECPYFACMPSKAMLHSAEIRHRIANAHTEGAVSRPLSLDDGKLAYRAAAARRYEVADRLDDAERAREPQALGVTVHRARGRVVRAGALEIDGRTIGWTDLVVAAGTVAVIPEIEGLDRASAWTSEDFYTASELPESALVLGGGPVGCEIAQVLARFGARVTIVQRAPRRIPAEEPAVAEILTQVFRREGIDVRPSARAVRSELRADAARLALADGAQLAAQKLIVAVGQAPRLDGLGLEALSIQPGADGFLQVDDPCRVGQPAGPPGPRRPSRHSPRRLHRPGGGLRGPHVEPGPGARLRRGPRGDGDRPHRARQRDGIEVGPARPHRRSPTPHRARSRRDRSPCRGVDRRGGARDPGRDRDRRADGRRPPVSDVQRSLRAAAAGAGRENERERLTARRRARVNPTRAPRRSPTPDSARRTGPGRARSRPRRSPRASRARAGERTSRCAASAADTRGARRP